MPFELKSHDFNLTPIFRPKSTAIIGISSRNPFAPGNSIFQKNLNEMETKTYGIGPKGGEIQGRKIYTSIDKLPEVPDLAVFAISAPRTLEAVKHAIDFGVKGGAIISGGFAETGREGRKMQEEIVKIAEDANFPFIGPNGIGVYSPPYIDTLFLPSERLVKTIPGNVGIISQSGGILIDQFFVGFTARNIGISSAVSIGNKALVNEADLLKYFEQDPHTDVITLYLEGFGKNQGRQFIEAARKCKKDVVVLSGGVTNASKAAASSHTGSLAANGSIMRGAFKQYSIINPQTEQQLQNTIKCYSILANPYRKYSTMSVNGNNIAVLSVSGGHGVIGADKIDQAGLKLAAFSDEQKNEMRDLMNPTSRKIASLNNPIDITGSGSDDDMVNLLDYLLRADNVDLIMTLIVPQVQSLSMDLGKKIAEKASNYAKPVVAYVPDHVKYDFIRKALEYNHIPTAGTIEETVQMGLALKLKGQGGIRKKFGLAQ
ncbi:MAG: CoA-binding protein [Promethearchaeota archaeon]